MMFIGLVVVQLTRMEKRISRAGMKELEGYDPARRLTYVWKPTIATHANLWLVHIDEDSWMS